MPFAGCRRYAERCRECEINEEYSRSVIIGCSAFAFVLFVVFVVFALLYDVMVLCIFRHWKKSSSLPGFFAAVVTARRASAHGWTPAKGRHVTNTYRNLRMTRRQKAAAPHLNRAKVMISFAQIAATLNTIYSIPWPKKFVEFLSVFALLDLNLLNVFPGVSLDCSFEV